jgi:hypothetical protein
LGFKNTDSIMGIHEYMQEVDRTDTIQMVYGQEAVVPLEFLVSSLCVEEIINITERGAVQERLSQLMELEEDMILARFHQEV